MDKTNVIPFGKNFIPGNKICYESGVNWTDNYKLLGIEIDKKLELLGQNYDMAHTKAQNIIYNWKARKLPINGRITISNDQVFIRVVY